VGKNLQRKLGNSLTGLAGLVPLLKNKSKQYNLLKVCKKD